MALLALIVMIALSDEKKADADRIPLALHRGMEIDDIDREIQRLHDTVLLKRGQIVATQRLAQRGLVSRSDLEREQADLRFQESHESEMAAYRAIKVYERDVLGKVCEPDERKAYGLLLEWVGKQLSVAQVDLDHRTFALGETRALFKRKAISRQELEDAELAQNNAEANVALSRSRVARVMLELSTHTSQAERDEAEAARLKTEYFRARVRYFEITAEGATRRWEIAKERSRLGQIPSNEVAFFENAAVKANQALREEKKLLEASQTAKENAKTPKG